jgi:Na+/alanine symporter
MFALLRRNVHFLDISEIPGVASLVFPFLSYIYVTSCTNAILNSEIPGVASLLFYIVEQRYQYLRNEHFFVFKEMIKS